MIELESMNYVLRKLAALAHETAGTAWPLLVRGAYTKHLVAVVTEAAVLCVCVVVAAINGWVMVRTSDRDTFNFKINLVLLIVSCVVGLVVLDIMVRDLPWVFDPEGMLALSLTSK